MFYHCYATANEANYWPDVRNLIAIAEKSSGVDKIYLLVAISRVKGLGRRDDWFLKFVSDLFNDHPVIQLEEVFFKDNVGRDFSSFYELYQKVAINAQPDDFILFQNRSAYGPFQENWYSQFLNQYQKFPDVGLCGATINIMNYKHVKNLESFPHVQTYIFLTQKKHMDLLKDDFPGRESTDSLEIVESGEIALSKRLIESSLALTCLEWPGSRIVDRENTEYPSNDIKKKVKRKHPFYHRMYFDRNWFTYLALIRKVSILKALKYF